MRVLHVNSINGTAHSRQGRAVNGSKNYRSSSCKAPSCADTAGNKRRLAHDAPMFEQLGTAIYLQAVLVLIVSSQLMLAYADMIEVACAMCPCAALVPYACGPASTQSGWSIRHISHKYRMTKVLLAQHLLACHLSTAAVLAIRQVCHGQ